MTAAWAGKSVRFYSGLLAKFTEFFTCGTDEQSETMHKRGVFHGFIMVGRCASA